MKSAHSYASVFAACSLTFAGAALAQDNPGNADRAIAASISRVSKDAVKHTFTARDLIGAPVYDMAGEKIGDISDIDLQGAISGDLASAYNADKSADERTTPAAGTTEANRPRTMSSVPSAFANATVFVSVGGLWGVGDDLVSVPASRLRYNSSRDRFEISASKADVVALAKAEDPAKYAADANRSATSAGKQSFTEEARRVQSALASDPETSAFASKVSVTTDGEDIQLNGTVDNREQRSRIVSAAKRATSLNVEDKLEVAK
jgi:hypothetical protein